jgi:hypothetical protein
MAVTRRSRCARPGRRRAGKSRSSHSAVSASSATILDGFGEGREDISEGCPRRHGHIGMDALGGRCGPWTSKPLPTMRSLGQSRIYRGVFLLLIGCWRVVSGRL